MDAGTLAYMAPECLDKAAAASTTPALDVWAIGIMFFTMIYGTLPFYSGNERELAKKITTEPLRVPRTHPITPQGREVLKAMLNKDATKRLELIDFVTMDYNTMDDEEFAEAYAAVQTEFREA